MADSVRPHRRQPTRLPRPWDSPGKNTGVGCHFLLQCMKVKSESEVAQLCLTLSDPMDCSLPGSSIHGIFQARILEWGAVAFSGPIKLQTFKHLSMLSHVRSCRSARVSGIHCHMRASSTSGCTFVYFTVQSSVAQYLHFKLRRSGSKQKSCSDIAASLSSASRCAVLPKVLQLSMRR